MKANSSYLKGFLPYALAALTIGLVGGFSTLLGPAFVASIGIDYSNTTWTALAQAMSTAACAPILGKLGDVFGRRAALLLGTAVFTLGNVLSAVAGSLFAMIAARFIAGIGSAAITPVILSYIVTQFPRERTAQGFAAYMLISSASVVFGPTLGSLIIAASGWRVMLWLCSALSAACFLACLFLSRAQHLPQQPLKTFDTPGAVLSLVFFSLLLCLPSFGQNFGWTSYPFLWVLVAAMLCLIGLIYAERHVIQPILPGSFMLRRPFILSVIALFLTQGLMQANMTNLIIFVNYTQAENSLVSGYAISVMYLGMALGAALLGPQADRFEPKAVLSFSLLLTGAGCACLLLFSEKTPFLLLTSALGLLGLGLGGNGTIFMKVVLSGLNAQHAGTATGTYGLFRDLSAPFGVAVFVPLFTRQLSAFTATGFSRSEAAVRAMHSLAWAELACVAGGAAAVLLLPKIHSRG